MDRVRALRLLPYHQLGFSQLAIRNSGEHRGIILWMDVAEDGVDFRVRAGTRRSRRGVAFLFPNGLKSISRAAYLILEVAARGEESGS